VSTIGPSAVTVTRSWTVPTGSVRSTVKTDAGGDVDVLLGDGLEGVTGCGDAVRCHRKVEEHVGPSRRRRGRSRAGEERGLEISTVAPRGGAHRPRSSRSRHLAFENGLGTTDRTLTPTRRRNRHIAVQGVLPNCIAILLRFTFIPPLLKSGKTGLAPGRMQTCGGCRGGYSR